MDATESEENEDPEDLLEREQFERSNRRMRKVALLSGRISLYAFGTSFLCAIFLMFIHYTPGRVFEYQLASVFVAVVCLVLPLSSALDLCLVVRLAWRGEKGLKVALLLGLPGALASVLIGYIVIGTLTR